MAGIFSISDGAFDSSEAALLRRSYDIALHGMRATHALDPLIEHRLARSIVKVARNEPDSLRQDGSIDPARLAQRAILRMLQMSAPPAPREGDKTPPAPREMIRVSGQRQARDPAAPANPGSIMMRLFERTPFAKL